MSKIRLAEHSHASPNTQRAAVRRGHAGKTHPNDKAGESPAVRKLRERMGQVKA